MDNPTCRLAEARAAVAAKVRRLLCHREIPVLVALDGPSGSGKSTLASLIVDDFRGVLVQSDDFYGAGIPDAGWDALTPAARAAEAINWRRLRAEALEPLLAGRPARWHAFDFDAGPRQDGTYRMQTAWVERSPSALIVLDGAYSARPELADLISLAVLVDAPRAVRHARLAAREDPSHLASWHERWDAAEEYYFTHVRPPSSFDLVVSV